MDRWLKTGNLKNTCDDSDLPLTNDKQIEHVKDNGLIENCDNNLLANSDLIVPTSGPKCHSNKRGVKRKYDESYLGFGFTWTGSEDYPGAQSRSTPTSGPPQSKRKSPCAQVISL